MIPGTLWGPSAVSRQRSPLQNAFGRCVCAARSGCPVDESRCVPPRYKKLITSSGEFVSQGREVCALFFGGVCEKPVVFFVAATTAAGTWNRAAGFTVLRTNEICQCLVVRIKFCSRKLSKPPRNRKLICAGEFLSPINATGINVKFQSGFVINARIGHMCGSENPCELHIRSSRVRQRSVVYRAVCHATSFVTLNTQCNAFLANSCERDDTNLSAKEGVFVPLVESYRLRVYQCPSPPHFIRHRRRCCRCRRRYRRRRRCYRGIGKLR